MESANLVLCCSVEEILPKGAEVMLEPGWRLGRRTMTYVRCFPLSVTMSPVENLSVAGEVSLF